MNNVEKVLVVLAHPDLESSRINRSLADAVGDREGVEVHDLEAAYPDHVIDVPAEQVRLADVDRIVLQYPTFWYSMPGLLKQWLDDVMVRGWAYGTGQPGALKGKGFQVVTSTGGSEEDYQPGGFQGWDYADVLIPLKATARRLGMIWHEPLIVHGVREVTDEQLAEYGQRYRDLLGDRRDESVAA
jgi:putative NADPH-quinone reductase